jgi:hypothetical protein
MRLTKCLLYNQETNLPGFNAKASLYPIGENYQETLVYPNQLELQSLLMSHHPPNPFCLRKCMQICRSDPNISEFNNCTWICNCECSGGIGCWQ